MPSKRKPTGVLRLGLCCQFVGEPIKFRTTTAAHLLRLSRIDQLEKLSQIALSNATALRLALEYCAAHGIGCFRIGSSILPVKTHPVVGYRVDELPNVEAIVAAFEGCGQFARSHDVRTVFHPDQFVVLNSPRTEVVQSSIDELEYHAEVAEWVNADVINIHAGGAYGDKPSALATFERAIERLSLAVKQRLSIENDDKVYTPKDLLPLCRATGLPLVYDVHHHRCLPDGMTVEDATAAALSTWNREPLLHISSPLENWTGPKPHRHHDFIHITDVPSCWRTIRATVEIEAKAKELAVLRLRNELLTQLFALK